MKSTMSRHLVVEIRRPGVTVVRFTHPDLRPQLDDYATTEDSELFQELQIAALADLAPGEALVINLGLIEIFTTLFLGFLLRVRQILQERRAWLVLCQLKPEHREIFEITKTLTLFTIAKTEAEAVCKARDRRARA